VAISVDMITQFFRTQAIDLEREPKCKRFNLSGSTYSPAKISQYLPNMDFSMIHQSSILIRTSPCRIYAPALFSVASRGPTIYVLVEAGSRECLCADWGKVSMCTPPLFSAVFAVFACSVDRDPR
jgi:hypothetical protein